MDSERERWGGEEVWEEVGQKEDLGLKREKNEMITEGRIKGESLDRKGYKEETHLKKACE